MPLRGRCVEHDRAEPGTERAVLSGRAESVAERSDRAECEARAERERDVADADRAALVSIDGTTAILVACACCLTCRTRRRSARVAARTARLTSWPWACPLRAKALISC